MNCITLDDCKRIHFVGAGGCSMSGIAQILHGQGHVVTGSDREEGPFTRRLAEMGIPVFIGHRPENVGNANLLVYSAAIREDNPERVHAARAGIPEMERSVALGQLSERFLRTLAIAGCHGKTTITSMLAHINAQTNWDASIHIGGYCDLLGGGVRAGGDSIFITEACEYVSSFLTLSPTIALINNIDDDHLDCYRDIDHIVQTFFRFLALVPPDGLVLGCTDDSRVEKLLQTCERKYRSYGLHSGDYHAKDIGYDENGHPFFTLIKDGEKQGLVKLSVPGTHNVVNALAAFAAADALGGIHFAQFARAIQNFSNTKRRFELLGERGGLRIYHDYAHHPGEIAATLEGASRLPHGKLFVVFQCNSFTRAKTLFTKNVRCFAHADTVLTTEIYPGRETDTGVVHAWDMVQAINKESGNAIYTPTFADVRAYLDRNASPGDIILTLGSGNVYTQSQCLL